MPASLASAHISRIRLVHSRVSSLFSLIVSWRPSSESGSGLGGGGRSSSSPMVERSARRRCQRSGGTSPCATRSRRRDRGNWGGGAAVAVVPWWWWAEPVVGGRGPTTWGPTPKTWRSKPSASPWPPSLPSCRRPPPTQWRSSGGLGHPGGPSHQLAGRRGVLTEVTVWRGNMTWDLRSVTDWVTQEWPEGKQGKACGCAHVMVGDIGQPCNLSSKLNESGSTFLTSDRWQLRQSLFQSKVDAKLCFLFELPHIYSTLTKYRGWITFKCQLCWGFIDIASPVILSKCCHPRRRLWAIIESMISTDHVLYYIYNKDYTMHLIIAFTLFL